MKASPPVDQAEQLRRFDLCPVTRAVGALIGPCRELVILAVDKPGMIMNGLRQLDRVCQIFEGECDGRSAAFIASLGSVAARDMGHALGCHLKISASALVWRFRSPHHSWPLSPRCGLLNQSHTRSISCQCPSIPKFAKRGCGTTMRT